MALWTLHAWALDAAYVSPFLMFSSPEMRCGNSTVAQKISLESDELNTLRIAQSNMGPMPMAVARSWQGLMPFAREPRHEPAMRPLFEKLIPAAYNPCPRG